MPTDVNVPKWRCDVCQTVYEGVEAHAAADHCEGSPTPEPLPAGTWLTGDLGDLLTPARWSRISDGEPIVRPRWEYHYADATNVPPLFDVEAVRPKHSGDNHRAQSRGVDGHILTYRTVYETPRPDAGRQIVDRLMDSNDMWPHRPGVLNFHNRPSELAENRWSATEAIGRRTRGSFQQVTDHEDSPIEVADREARAALFDLLYPGDEVSTGWYAGPHTFGLDDGTRYHGDSMPRGAYLQPGLDGDVRDAIMALCDDKTDVDRSVPNEAQRLLKRDPTEFERSRYGSAREWKPTPESPHYGLSTGRGDQSRHWLDLLALLDHDGDGAAALAWLTNTTRDEHCDRLEAEVLRFLSGDLNAIVPGDMFKPSYGMSRGPREGLMRPEHKRVAASLGVDWDSKPRDVINPYFINARSILDHFGVTVTNVNEPMFGGAPVVLVTSGKGGVGKTTTCAALAERAALNGHRVFVVDADVTGPSMGSLYGLTEGLPVDDNGFYVPTEVKPGLMVASNTQIIAPDQTITWGEDTTRLWLRFLARSPHLADVDLVLVDMPPGRTAQHTAVDAEFKPTGSLIVTSGSPLAHADAGRALGYRDKRLGVIESLSVDHRGDRIYAPGVTEAWAAERDVPFLGSLGWAPDPSDLARQTAIGHVLAALPFKAVAR